MTNTFPKNVPVNPTLQQLTDYVRYMKERLELVLRNKDIEIAELKSRVEELEGS